MPFNPPFLLKVYDIKQTRQVASFNHQKTQKQDGS
jgi:hypothetical protein